MMAETLIHGDCMEFHLNFIEFYYLCNVLSYNYDSFNPINNIPFCKQPQGHRLRTPACGMDLFILIMGQRKGYKRSKESLIKASITLKETHSKKTFGFKKGNHPQHWKGRKHPEETKNKIRESMKINNPMFNPETAKKGF